ncbi:hypothetical protein [Actinacidiphila acidipaludis]|uniref:Uncharacterized protein n=1 Tax=Actinacidiphila acidipaludis TaxID=2873382 RepID=A0ABS7QBJ8_9ACTN|nr:hypothetical protein [Streptomyces acidipaludis]MBY8880555.1 hypothetical protein [Streptomyces acidipaludis]
MAESETEERELRALLERAVPQLSAPAQRLECVRTRIRRRRRRRAAGLSGAAVLAVVLAGLLVPGTGGSAGVPAPGVRSPALALPASAGPSSAGPSSASTSSPDAPSGATSPPTPTSTEDAARDDGGVLERHFTKLGGLLLRVPGSWSVLAPGGSTSVWISSQALALPAGGCDKALDGFCTPLQRTLAQGGLLLQLSFEDSPAMAAKARLRGQQIGDEDLFTACRSVGGTEQLGTQITDPSGSAVLVIATACLAHPRPAQEAQVRDVLTTADFT